MDNRASYQKIPNMKLGQNHAKRATAQNRNEDARAASRSELKTLNLIIGDLQKSKGLKSDAVFEVTLTECHKRLRNLIRARLGV